MAVKIGELIAEEKRVEKKIQEAEAQAAQLKKEAEETAQLMLQECESDLDKFLEQETAPTEKEFQKKKAAAERGSTKNLEKLREEASKKHLKAVKYVVESILGEEE